MLIDASAIVAVLAREPRGNEIETALNLASEHETKFHVASITVFEASISLAKAKIKPRPTATPAEIKQALQAVQGFLAEYDVKQISTDGDIVQKAVEVSARFGKAVGHKAKLNFGDCIVYASAQAHHLPLLFIGKDFSQTDLKSVLASPEP